MLSIEFTREELQALNFWLRVIQFQGTREQVRKPLELYDAVVVKVEAALEPGAQEIRPVNDVGKFAREPGALSRR